MTAQLSDTRWMSRPAVSAVIHALEAADGQVRFVGGCVRDSFLGRPVGEIDLCTDLEPPAVQTALDQAAIRSIPTGIDHGTVTAVVADDSIEVTSLRRDVETDGRRAVVSFTKDFREDSLRRDFTINALYADRSGAVSDFHNGLSDIAAGRLRFIGNAEERIREDYLRILRFYRFHAQLDFPLTDNADRAACRNLREGLTSLSAERVTMELRKLLSAADPTPILDAMISDGALEAWLPEVTQTDVVSRLIGVEESPDVILRLAALVAGTNDREQIPARLKLSNTERDRFLAIGKPTEAPATAQDTRKIVYTLGNDVSLDIALLGIANGTEDWSSLAETARAWRSPTLPIQGQDVVEAGISPGPEVGKTLRQVETRWIESDFSLPRSALLEIVEALVSKVGGKES